MAAGSRQNGTESDSISLEGTRIQTTNFKKMADRPTNARSTRSIISTKNQMQRGVLVWITSVSSASKEPKDRTPPCSSTKPIFKTLIIKTKSFELPLNSLYGTAFLPITLAGNETSFPVHVENLTSFVQGNDSTWSIERLSVETSLFHGNIDAMAASEEWLVQMQLNKSADLSALKVPPIAQEILQSVIKAPETTEISGRVWIDTSTLAIRSAIAVHGISAIGNVTDSLALPSIPMESGNPLVPSP